MKQVLLLLVALIVGMILTLIFGKGTFPGNAKQNELDSLKQQLSKQLELRDSLTTSLDSLLSVTDSLTGISKEIEVRIIEVPGSYDQYNSQELQQKMIEGYNARQVN